MVISKTTLQLTIQLKQYLIKRSSILQRRHSVSPSLSQIASLSSTQRFIKVNLDNSANPVKMNINVTPIRNDRGKLDFNSPSMFYEDFLKPENKFNMSSK
jgi:hypothetical protein